MMQLRLYLTAETPLSFRDGVDLVASELNRYVPGTAMLGALAEAHQRLRGDPQEFARFFLEDRVIFGNAYPATFEAESLTKSEQLPVAPIPATARSGKRFGGFRFDGQHARDRRDGVTDGLVPMALFALSGESRADLLEPTRRFRRDTAEIDLDRISGFYRQGLQLDEIGKARLSPDLRTRTGINYRTGTVQQEILYSIQVLPERSVFWSCWTIADDGAEGERLRDRLEMFVEDLVESGMLRLGNNRTRGFGRVQARLMEYAGDTAAALVERVRRFQQLLGETARQHQIDLNEGVYVPITLTSDVLLYDDLLRSRLQIAPGDLAAHGIPDAELVYHTAGVRRVRGWNTLLGLPRADMAAISMGSVFLFRLPAAFADWPALLRLQQTGLGLRRVEGYGAISIADRFHLDSAGGRLR
ncbi:hypothetical protein EKD04_025370 [Chloroflexales bacterium ZM16-3]|nr:hypothetical protein [Chloroflexales bacterium ZM16-3]